MQSRKVISEVIRILKGIHLMRDAIKEGYSRGDQPWNR
jgi:hypothetical protein